MHMDSADRERASLATTQRRWLVLLAALLLGPTGCYHAGRHTIAQQMQTAFKEARLSEALNEERELSQKMLDAEVAAVRRSVDAERDNALTLILGQTLAGGAADKTCSPAWSGGKAGSLLCDIDFRIERLVLVNHQCAPGSTGSVACAEAAVLNEVNAYVTGHEEKVRKEASLKEIGRTINILRKSRGLPALPFTCSPSGLDELKATLSKASPTELGILMAQPYISDCVSLLALEPTQVAAGHLPDARSELESLSTSLDEASANATKSKKEFDTALAEYEQAVSKDGDVTAALKKVKDKLDMLGGVRDSGRIPGEVAEAAARYDAVVLAVNHILEGKPEEKSGLERVLVTATNIEKIDQEGRLPLLLLEAERLRGLVEAARARLAHAERQRALLRTRIEALSDELRLLIEARRLAAGPAHACATAKPTLLESFQAAGGNCKIDLATALLQYGNAWSVGERRARVALVQLNGDLHLQAIDLSAAAIKQWESVLAVPIDAVVKRHAGGVKPEELARLLVEIAGFTVVGVAAAAP